MTNPSSTTQVATDQMSAPSRHSSTNIRANHEFDEYYDQAKSLGFNVLRTRHPHLSPVDRPGYLSREAQRRYWKEHKLLNALHPKPLPTHPDIVRSDWIGVFSLLAYTRRLDYFEDYFLTKDISDDKFPLLEQPPSWPRGAPVSEALFQAVKEHQHRFFPLIFNRCRLHDRTVPSSQALPITSLKQLREGEHLEASVYKVELDPEYNGLDTAHKASNEGPTCNTFVLKVQSSKTCHQNEVNAFKHLRNSKSGPGPNIVKFYGSFIQDGVGCLILEYVDGPNLLHYLEHTPPPLTPTDLLLFWKSFSGYFQGLHRIHQVAHSASEGDFVGVHGDLKPENLLLHRNKGPSSNAYDFEPKLADFGCSDFRQAPPEGQDKRCKDHYGNPNYCAPEASHHIDSLVADNYLIDFAADIFSMGAIMSEVFTWIAFGWDGVKEYLELRKECVGRKRGYKGSGNAGVFHDGIRVWPLVKEQHQRVRDALPISDSITPKMIDLVDEHMLDRDHRKRWKALELVKEFENKHEQATEEMRQTLTPFISSMNPNSDPQTPTRPSIRSPNCSILTESPMANAKPSLSPFSDTSLPLPSLTSPITPNSISCSGDGFPISSNADNHRPVPTPIINPERYARTVAELASDSGPPDPVSNGHLRIPDPGSAVSSRAPSSIRPRPYLRLEELEHFYRHSKRCGPPPTPQVLDDIKALQHCIKGRDHIFYIDNSDTMARHKPDVEKAFRLMSYVAKQADCDGVELVFGSHPKKVFRNRKTRRLLAKLQKQAFEPQSGLMQNQFDQFVGKVLIPRLDRLANPSRLSHPFTHAKTGLSVMVFTDGDWEEGGERAAGVENPVKRLMKEAILRNIGDTEIAISFVQFGNCEGGERRLKYLDDFGRKNVFKHGDWAARNGDTEAMYDIIDTGPNTGSIYKLLVGSIIQSNDNDEG